jgi:hypothetical protein
MVDVDYYEREIRANQDIQNFHRRMCDSLRSRDVILADIVDIVNDWGVLFIPHENTQDTGVECWNVRVQLSRDSGSNVKIEKVFRFISGARSELYRKVHGRKEILLTALALCHELGHIIVFENEDLKKVFMCPFIRLEPQRVCPYLEVRAFEEGIKIFEDVLQKFDPETKSKQKGKKFFMKMYLSGVWRATLTGDCAVELSATSLDARRGSEFCPAFANLQTSLLNISVGSEGTKSS